MQNDRTNTLINVNDLIKEKFPNSVIENDEVVSFTDEVEEYNLIKHGTGIRLIESNAFLKLIGKDSLEFLHRISTNDLKSLEFSKVRNTIFTNEKGRMLDVAHVVNQEDEILLIGSEKNNRILESWLNRYIIMEDIKINDLTDNFVSLEFYGSQAESLLIMICGKVISEIADDKFESIQMFDKSVGFFKSKFLNGNYKYFVAVKNEDLNDVLEELINTETVFDFGFVGKKAFDLFRIENKIPIYPNEINDNFNPHEIGLIDFVSFTKGCYIGQEVIARLDTYDKVQRELKKVCINDSTNISELPLEIVTDNDEDAGIITSFVSSELLNKKIGLALIRKKYKDNELYIVEGKERIKIKIKD